MYKKVFAAFAVLALSLALYPGHSQAADESEKEGLNGKIKAGVSGVDMDNESSKYGEYTGIEDNDFFFLGKADLFYYREGYYLDFKAKNIGIQNRRMYLEKGKFGNFKFFLGFEQTPHLINHNSRTPFANIDAQSSNLTLDSGITPGFSTDGSIASGGDPAAISGLTSDNLHPIELELERTAGFVGFRKELPRDLGVEVSFRREKKVGTKSIGAVFGPSGAPTNRSIVLPEPVDYDNNILRAAVDYTGKEAQARLEYYYSTFDNEEESLTWENIFVNSVEGFASTGRMALPPDNKHQRISLSGGVNLPMHSRISAVGEIGELKQEEALLPFATTTDGSNLPRSNASAEIDTTHFMVNATTRAIPRVGVNVRYRYYQTDNNTPRDVFLKVANDTGSQVAATDDQAARNLPFDHTSDTVDVDVSTYLFKGTNAKLGYTYENVTRNFREVDETAENTIRASVHSGYFDEATLGADYAYSTREIEGEYSQLNVFKALHSDAHYTDEGCPSDSSLCFDNHPLLRKFDVADRERNKLGLYAVIYPAYDTAVGFYFNLTDDDYYNSTLGLTDRETKSFTVDATWSPREYLSLYGFYTREEIETRQAGRDFTGTGGGKASAIDPTTGPTLDWTAEHDEDVDTIGAGVSVSLLDNMARIKADYTFAQSSAAVGFTTASGLDAPTDMPGLKTRRHNISVKGEYKVLENVGLGAGYQYESYEEDDWSTDGLMPASTQLPRLLALSGSVRDYEAHLGMVYLTYYLGKRLPY